MEVDIEANTWYYIAVAQYDQSTPLNARLRLAAAAAPGGGGGAGPSPPAVQPPVQPPVIPAVGGGVGTWTDPIVVNGLPFQSPEGNVSGAAGRKPTAAWALACQRCIWRAHRCPDGVAAPCPACLQTYHTGTAPILCRWLSNTAPYPAMVYRSAGEGAELAGGGRAAGPLGSRGPAGCSCPAFGCLAHWVHTLRCAAPQAPALSPQHPR